jgi:hypothetical protein
LDEARKEAIVALGEAFRDVTRAGQPDTITIVVRDEVSRASYRSRHPLIPQGWTIRQVLAEPDMCSMAYLYRDLLPHDEDFSKQYARAFELRNEYWAEEMAEIADDARNDWMTRTYGDTEIDVPNPEVVNRSKLRIETRKRLMGKSLPKKYGDKTIVSGDADNPIAQAFTLKIEG